MERLTTHQYHVKAFDLARFVEELLTASGITCDKDNDRARCIGEDDYYFTIFCDLDTPLEDQKESLARSLTQVVVSPVGGRLAMATSCLFSRMEVPRAIEDAENLIADRVVVRYIAAWDPFENRRINRGDMLLKFYFPALPEPAISPVKEIT